MLATTKKILVARCFWCLCAALMTCSPFLTDALALAQPDPPPSIRIERQGYAMDPSRQLTLTRILVEPSEFWQPFNGEAVPMPRHANVWMRFNITLPTDDVVFVESPWNVAIKGAYLYQLGTPSPTKIAPDRLHASLFHLNLSKGTHEFAVLLHDVNSRSLKPLINAETAVDYALSHSTRRQVHGLTFGIAMGMLCLCLGMLVMTRRPQFLFYATYSISMLWTLAIGAFQLPNQPASVWNILGIISSVSIYLFMSSTLDLKRLAPRLFTAMTAITLGFVVTATLDMAFDVDMRARFFQVALAVLVIAATLGRMRQGDKAASFLFFGWSIFVAGWMVTTIGLYRTIPLYATYSLYICYAIESVLFALGILFVAKQSEAKALAQSEHALDQLSKVFYPHQISQIRGGAILESTMPCGEANACVICFDLVGSTQIKHERVKEFFQDIFRRCDEVMVEGYDPGTMTASAYRVKQVGDGFICSVGYPLRSLTGSMANDAVTLALRFYEVFSEEVVKFQYHEPIHCCMGMAMDQIASFFPAAGTKSYDLYGRGLALATRYEHMRKALFPHNPAQSLLIIQECVFASLGPDLRLRFERIDLAAEKVVVRDDPDARCLFVARLDARPAQLKGPNPRAA